MAKIDVIYSVWGVGDEAAGDAQVFAGGVQDVRLVRSPEEFVSSGAARSPEEHAASGSDAPRVIEAKYVAAGEAASVVRLVEATDAERSLLEGHVQSQEDSEAAYQAAVEAGTWHEGNLMQFVAQTEQRLALSDEEANLTPGDRRWLSEGLADAHEKLGNTDAASLIRDRLAVDAENSDTVEIGPQDIQSAKDVLGAQYGYGSTDETDDTTTDEEA